MMSFLGKYKEIRISFDTEILSVEADGLCYDNTWENFFVGSEMNNPEEYAYGVYDSLKGLFPNIPIIVGPERLVSTEGWHLGDED